MLVYWSFNESDFSLCPQSQLEALALELIRVRRLGYHIISVSRQTISLLMNRVSFSSELQTQLRAFAREYAQTGNLKDQAPFYIEIASFNHDMEVSERKIRVSVNSVVNQSILDNPKMIVENIDNDGWLIDFILYNASFLPGMRLPKIHFLHGGGGDAIRVMSHEIAQKNIVCVLLDSAKKYPSAGDSMAVRRIKRAYEALNWPLCFLVQTPCHELENLLPFSVIANLMQSSSEETLSIIREIIDAEELRSVPLDEAYWLWFDIKRGTVLEERKNFNRACVAWHSQKLALSNRFNGRIMQGFGEHVIPTVAKEGRIHGDLRKGINSENWIAYFGSTFRHIYWIFAASPKIVT